MRLLPSSWVSSDLLCELVGLPYPVALDRVGELGLTPFVLESAVNAPASPDAFVQQAHSWNDRAMLSLVSDPSEAQGSVDWCAELGFPPPRW